MGKQNRGGEESKEGNGLRQSPAEESTGLAPQGTLHSKLLSYLLPIQSQDVGFHISVPVNH